METASFEFVAFGLGIALLANLSRRVIWRQAVLLLASLVFLSLLTRQPSTFIPLAGFLAVGFLIIKILKRGAHQLTGWGVLVVILLYIWLKKYTFLPPAIFIKSPYLTLGLSYILFRLLHLIIELGAATLEQEVSLGSYLAYLLNFTTFISGPIQRYDEFAAQFYAQPARISIEQIAMGVERIVLGLFKVNVVALVLSMVRDDALLAMHQSLPMRGRLENGLMVIALYPFFIYANFSGYIDVVIGIGRLLGLTLPENFNRPFSTASQLEFWNAWHITLSNWLKNYVYNSLMINLMRRIPSPSLTPYIGVFAFFVTFFLVGVWHGRTSEFLVYGLLLGGGVAVNKLWQIFLISRIGQKPYRKLASDWRYKVVARGLNFAWFAFSLVCFWGSWAEIRFIGRDLGTAGVLFVAGALWILSGLILSAFVWIREKVGLIEVAKEPMFSSRYIRTITNTSMIVITVVFDFLLKQPAPEIVYRKF